MDIGDLHQPQPIQILWQIRIRQLALPHLEVVSDDKYAVSARQERRGSSSTRSTVKQLTTTQALRARPLTFRQQPPDPIDRVCAKRPRQVHR